MTTQSILQQFDEKFDEEFYDLHYRFCPIVGSEDFEKRQDTCSKQRKEVVDKIKSFLSHALEQQKKEMVEVLEGMQSIKKPNDDLYSQWDLGYEKALADIITLLENK